MKDRADEIRRRHQERKGQRRSSVHSKGKPHIYHEPGEREDYLSVHHPHSGDQFDRSDHAPARKQWMVFRVMLAIVLFLAVGVMFKSPAPVFEGARGLVKDTFQNEFQFAMVGDWYQKQFGEPLALFPKSNNNDEMKANTEEPPNYAEPVSGTVTEDFADTEKGIMLETNGKEAVKAVKQGMVNYVGTDPNLGKVVKIGHPDGTESWYGKLENANVKLYTYVESSEKIGTVTPSKDGKSGTFYFALRKGDTFINPLKVISFD